MTRQKGKADAPEAQGQMSRKSIYHLSTLRLKDEGDEPVHCHMKSQEGRIQLITNDDLEKELAGLGKRSCNINSEEDSLV